MATKRRHRLPRREALQQEDGLPDDVLSSLVPESQRIRMDREDSMDRHREDFEGSFYADPEAFD